MANWFDELTKTLAEDTLSRRAAFRRIAGIVGGVALATWLPDQALARGKCHVAPDCNGFYLNEAWS